MTKKTKAAGKDAPKKKALMATPAAPVATQSAAVADAQPAAAAKPATAAKADKARKPKLVRDSFTIPKEEYAVLDMLKERAAKLGRPTKKSEVLRAGVQALAAMPDSAFLASVGAVPALKTGRPAKA